MSFNLLIVGRFIQALGACVGLKVSFTMIADSFEQVAATRMISKIIIVFAIMPGIAVAIGGWITHYLNWESCFYFLVLFSFVVFYLATRLPETAKFLDRKALNFSSIIHGYGVKFKNPRILLSGIMMGCGLYFCLQSAVHWHQFDGPLSSVLRQLQFYSHYWHASGCNIVC
jgi:DHA1 family bicyclomycin/chloramphenicol resistance-like MFS transporter